MTHIEGVARTLQLTDGAGEPVTFAPQVDEELGAFGNEAGTLGTHARQQLGDRGGRQPRVEQGADVPDAGDVRGTVVAVAGRAAGPTPS